MNYWKAKEKRDNTTRLLQLLNQKEELTFKQLKESLQVSEPTLSEYIKLLEKEDKIEHFEKPEDRRSKWYRIKPKSKAQVQFMLDKLLLLDLIYRLDYPDVLHFLQDFIMELIALRREAAITEQVDLEALVEQAKKSTFKILPKMWKRIRA